jgi:hypothetical protein
MEIRQIQTVTNEEKYLGLPTPQGHMGKGTFKSTKERLSKKFSSWVERHMSSGAKEALIKSVLQAIPTYIMGVFKLPNTQCEEMERMIRYFWWGDEEGARKIHWLAWEKLLMPKPHGGLGFRDLKLFNKALLARQTWRLIQFSNSMCTRLLKAKYYPMGELVDTAFPAEVSPTWKAIMHGLDLLKRGIIWRVQSGSKVQIWRDMDSKEADHENHPEKKGRSRLRWVSQLMVPGRREWDEKLSCVHAYTRMMLKRC